MSKLPSLTGRQVVKALQKAGFTVIRQKGSHAFLRHPDGRSTVVPLHAGETVGPGLLLLALDDNPALRNVLETAGLSSGRSKL